jgi:ATP sulfurylase
MFKSRNRRRESSNRVIENARLVSSSLHPFPLVFPVEVNRVGVRTVEPIYTHFINATRRKFCQL